MPGGVYPRTEEWKAKARKWLAGTQFRKGSTSWNKGKKYQIGQGKYVRTEEQKQMLRTIGIGRTPWNKGIFGSKSHTWKGGLTQFTNAIRNSEKYKTWRAEVYRRDGWTCQTCGLRGHGNDIEAHHIKTVSELLKQVQIAGISYEEKYQLAMSISELFDVSNGVTLCKDCHILTFKGEKNETAK